MGTNGALTGYFRVRHKIRGRPGFGGRDGSFEETLVVRPKERAFSVAEAAKALGLTAEQLRRLIHVLATDRKLQGFVYSRITDTLAFGRDLKDEEPYEPLNPAQTSALDPSVIEALAYLD